MSDATLGIVVVPFLLVLALAVLEGTRLSCAWLVGKARAGR